MFSLTAGDSEGHRLILLNASELSSSEDEVAIVAAVGDLLGDEGIKALEERGVSTNFVQRNPHPTGRVDIQLDAQGLASYQFAEDALGIDSAGPRNSKIWHLKVMWFASEL